MLNKPEDNFAFRDDQEKEELQDDIRATKLALESRLMIYAGVGFLGCIILLTYIIFKCR